MASDARRKACRSKTRESCARIRNEAGVARKAALGHEEYLDYRNDFATFARMTVLNTTNNMLVCMLSYCQGEWRRRSARTRSTVRDESWGSEPD